MKTNKKKNEVNFPEESFFVRAKADFRINWSLYLLILPVLAFYILFCYRPMYGALIAFQDYTPGQGMLGSQWVGFKHFIDFFTTNDFPRLMKNTLRISFASLIFGFPAPIILALLINEINNAKFKKVTQTVSYLPHFISMVVLCGMIKDFVGSEGVISQTIAALTGGESQNYLQKSNAFLPIYLISNIWSGMGWDSIIYIAALTGIDMQLYEAAKIDGAGRWQQLFNVTLPGIIPTIIIMLILRIGRIMGVGYEKIILLYNPLIYDKSDVISTYVYRTGFSGQQWSYTTAIGLFNSVVNFIMLVLANTISKKVNETSLW